MIIWLKMLRDSFGQQNSKDKNWKNRNLRSIKTHNTHPNWKQLSMGMLADRKDKLEENRTDRTLIQCQEISYSQGWMDLME